MKLFKRIFGIIIFLGIGTFVFGQENNEFVNEAAGYKINFTDGWVNESSDNNRSLDISFRAPRKGVLDMTDEFITISYIENENSDLIEMYELFVLGAIPTFINYKEIDQKEEVINGMKSKWIHFEADNNNGQRCQTMIHTFYGNGKFYYIISTGLLNPFKERKAEFEKVINSFTIIN